MSFKRVSDFSSDGIEFAANAVSGTATYGQDTDIDFTLSENLMLVGVESFLDGNQAWDDYATLQVMYGDTVVNTFGYKWFFCTDVKQSPLVLTIPANIPAGLKIRIKYHSTGEVNVKCKFNLHLYRPK